MGPGGPPMMGGFPPGDGPPHPGGMPPGPSHAGGNYFNNFFNQQDGMKMEGMGQEGENEFLRSNISLSLYFCGFCTAWLTHCFLSGDNYQGFAGMDEKGGAGNFGNQSGGPEGSTNGASTNQGGISVPDFLPPAQRVLFLRIQQKQQEEEERARRIAEGGSEKTRDTEGRKMIQHLLLIVVEYVEIDY